MRRRKSRIINTRRIIKIRSRRGRIIINIIRRRRRIIIIRTFEE